MLYTLMHKNIPTMDIEIDEILGGVTHIRDIHNAEHLPVGVTVKDRAALNDWWVGRSIPASRMGLREALETLKISSSRLLLTKCFGLSLSDQYWVCRENSNLEWEKVNFFTNAFSEDIGKILFGQTPDNTEISLMSPDNTSDGWLKKKWIIADGKRCLVKGGSGESLQEPFNEVLASAICERLGIESVPYSVIWEKEQPFSICENFITPETELVSAWHILQTQKQENNVSRYQHYVNCCKTLGINNIIDKLNKMLVLDYLIMNEDRHFNNFGAVRNAETLEWVGAAPIFDSGTSMWHNKDISRMLMRNDDSKPFRGSHSKQIKLVSSYDFIDFSKLKDISEICNEIYRQSPYISDGRRERLCSGIEFRVKQLDEIARDKNRVYALNREDEELQR
jgi:hypothetical protein